MRVPVAALVPALALGVLVPAVTRGEPRARPLASAAVEVAITVRGTPEAVYDAMTGEAKDWWDHGFVEQPRSRFIEARPGGTFHEVFDAEGNGCVHATVIYAHRGRLLRMSGPLGFSGNATELVTTWSYEARGDSTRVTATCNFAGQLEPGEDAAIERVWTHFLVDRFKPWYERGGHLARPKARAAPRRGR